MKFNNLNKFVLKLLTTGNFHLRFNQLTFIFMKINENVCPNICTFRVKYSPKFSI